MSVITFAPAAREQVKARVCVEGLAGTGKTLTALKLARDLSGPRPFAVLDTQAGQSRHYVGRFGDLQFGIVTPTSYHPQSLIDTIAAAQDQGFATLVVDSGSAFWEGTDGVMQLVDSHKDKFGGGWKSVSPIERRMIEAFTHCEMHFIMTLRVKSDYVLEEGENASGGRTTKPRKVGMKAVQRDGLDYEFDLAGVMDSAHTFTVTKSVIDGLPVGTEWAEPGENVSELIAAHCDLGVPVEGPRSLAARALESTFDELREMRDDVVARGLTGAAVINADGESVTLLDLIVSRAKTLAPRGPQRGAA